MEKTILLNYLKIQVDTDLKIILLETPAWWAMLQKVLTF